MESVYVIGGAGVGKSTFVSQLLDQLGVYAEPVEDLYRGPGGGKDSFRTRRIRGHRLVDGESQIGTYLGVLREDFPGTDGLDKVILPVCVRWIPTAEITGFLVAEGLRLANPDFLIPLSIRSNLRVVHLTADELTTDLRLLGRGAGQPPQFIAASRTRAQRLAVTLRESGLNVVDVDAGDPTAWNRELDRSTNHLHNLIGDLS